MMREIKFRAWSNNVNQMFKVVKINWVSCAVWFKNAAYIGNLGEHDITLLQYIGLKDKNNREIYEGDIVKVDDAIFVVTWDTFGWAFFDYIDGIGCNEMWADAACKVIGNIYKNKKLLKK